MNKGRLVSCVLLALSMTISSNLLTSNKESKTKEEVITNSPNDRYKNILKQVNTYAEELEGQRLIEEKARIAEEQRIEEERIKKEIEENRIYVTFEVSFYTISADECGNSDGIGASGNKVTPWHSIALPSDIPFGSTATIEGLGTFTNDDTGSYIEWTNDGICRVDILVEDKETAIKLGRYQVEGYIDVKRGE